MTEESYKCPFANDPASCPDIRRLQESSTGGRVDENLADQYHELCTVANGFGCSTRERLVSQEER